MMEMAIEWYFIVPKTMKLIIDFSSIFERFCLNFSDWQYILSFTAILKFLVIFKVRIRKISGSYHRDIEFLVVSIFPEKFTESYHNVI